MRKVITLAALLTITLLTAVNPAGAEKFKVNFGGAGTYLMRIDGSAVLSGDATGDPLNGHYEATLIPMSGLPEPGTCEPATLTVRLDGVKDRFLELSSDGQVCGQYLQPPNVVTQVFTGRYTVTAGSRRPLVGTDGFVELRLTVDGRAFVFAVDT